MTIDVLAKQGRKQIPTTLAEVNTNRLKQMRNAGLRSCFEHFNEMRYRMEFVARINGKTFINDASSRNVNATWFTLESMNGSLIWIANGNDSTANYSRLRPAALRKVHILYCVGDNNENLHKSFEGIIPTIIDVPTLGEAVNQAFYSDMETASVVYSPASDNGLTAKENGERFRMEVNEL
ncbi:MAG: hypothetical protein IJ764_03865 [Bacteroidales bacterium]|nr:hypothetical protein [Bacteroidales bacterium]